MLYSANVPVNGDSEYIIIIKLSTATIKTIICFKLSENT